MEGVWRSEHPRRSRITSSKLLYKWWKRFWSISFVQILKKKIYFCLQVISFYVFVFNTNNIYVLFFHLIFDISLYKNSSLLLLCLIVCIMHDSIFISIAVSNESLWEFCARITIRTEQYYCYLLSLLSLFPPPLKKSFFVYLLKRFKNSMRISTVFLAKEEINWISQRLFGGY